MKAYLSSSSEETKRLGEKLAKKIFKSYPGKTAKIVALTGELGSGKTTFVQGFFRGLGIKKRATSPTFVIFRRLVISHSRFANVFHVDAYRLRKPEELQILGFKEILENPKNIVLIEWAEKIKNILPKKVLWLEFKHNRGESERIIKAK